MSAWGERMILLKNTERSVLYAKQSYQQMRYASILTALLILALMAQGQPEDSTKVKVLDPSELYMFPDPFNGREPIDLTPPENQMQEEATLRFHFWILPDGTVHDSIRVESVHLKDSLPPTLVKEGKKAIRQWRFTPLPETDPQENTELAVTITFKLKD